MHDETLNLHNRPNSTVVLLSGEDGYPFERCYEACLGHSTPQGLIVVSQISGTTLAMHARGTFYGYRLEWRPEVDELLEAAILQLKEKRTSEEPQAALP